MQARVHPVSGPIHGRMRVPGSKSITNRALVCAAMAQGTSELVNASESDDTTLLSNGLNLLGVLARRAGDRLVVEGQGGMLSSPKFPIPIGNAGTTFRFLLSLSGLAKGTTRFSLSPRMAERPLDDLVRALDQLGVRVERDVSGLVVSVHGGGIRGGKTTLRGDRSSQFLSSLLMAAPRADGAVSITVEGTLPSAPYVRMTIDVLRAFGITVTATDDLRTFDVPASQRFRPVVYPVESDASGASYPFGAAAIAGGEMCVEGLHTQSLQGDTAFVRVLERMGCTVRENGGAMAVSRTGELQGIDVDMNGMPDVVPTLAAVALFAGGPTRIRNVAHLRFKESNRLETLAEELRKLGAHIDVHDDGLSIVPKALRGASLSSHDDHRLAMVFGLIGLKIPGVVINGAECVTKSYPAFWDELGTLAGVTRTE
ncbi:MAG TPA: 3-phosphoshikimate 1-carboxyvinyltransferase [Bacteroidota bacterium]|nr:3-phosphoshikimate 1-carboxyvinyltransferase [Bacteroidota bacterium]